MSIRNVVLFTVFAGAPMAFAQVQSGRLVGTIYDQTHAAIPGASVTVTNTATRPEERQVVKRRCSEPVRNVLS